MSHNGLFIHFIILRADRLNKAPWHISYIPQLHIEYLSLGSCCVLQFTMDFICYENIYLLYKAEKPSVCLSDCHVNILAVSASIEMGPARNENCVLPIYVKVCMCDSSSTAARKTQ